MKKLMLICSLAFTFLLGASDLSAQFVPTNEATLIVRNEIQQLEQAAPLSTGTLGASSTVSIDVRLKKAFLGLVHENLTASANAEVEGAIEAAYNAMAVNVDANKNAMVAEVKQFTEELLAD